MTESTINTLQRTDQAYRALTKEAGAYVIDLGDLFTAIEQDEKVKLHVSEVLSKLEPITILIEGSAFTQNITVVDQIVNRRKNPNDRVVLIDISRQSVHDHRALADTLPSSKQYLISQGDMNNIPLENGSVDLVINDCAINFNGYATQNTRTMSEIKRVMKQSLSACLISTVVPRRYDGSEYGYDQELVPSESADKPEKFYPLTYKEPSTEISRLCWPAPYYKQLFANSGFQFSEFDVARGKTYFPEKSQISYRRFVLTPQDVNS